MLILNWRTNSDSTAVISEHFPSECVRSICVCGVALEPFPALALPGQAWVLRGGRVCLAAAAAVLNTGQGSERVLSVSGAASPGALLRMLKEREPFLFRAQHPLLCLCCLSSPAQSVILAPQSNCHTVNLLSPLLQLGSATEWMDYFQKSIGIWEHISFLCAGSWVKKPWHLGGCLYS